MGEKVLFGFWHGLGDNIMAIPALRELSRTEPELGIGWAVRKDIDVAGVLEGCPYIDRVHPVFPDPWGSTFTGRYLRGRMYALRIRGFQRVLRRLAKSEGYDRWVVVTTLPEMARSREYRSIRYHKIFRIAQELGVKVRDTRTEVYIEEDDRKRAKRFLRGLPRPHIFLHREASITRKEISAEEAISLTSKWNGGTVIECGNETVVPGSRRLDLSDIRRNIAIIESCDRAVCIDSANMHFAGALVRPLTAVFKTTPIHQALPLHYEVEVVCDDEEYNRLWNISKRQLERDHPTIEAR
jgi:ADP-heptose:LPS heptosyltransferase